MTTRTDHDLPPLRLPLTPYARKEELLYAGLPALVSVALLGSWLSGGPVALAGIGLAGLAFAGMAASFFRDPRRVPPGGEETVVSPADGKVISVKEVEGDDFIGGPAIEIDIFLSIFNAHVNRAPISGVVESVEHADGEYLSALRLEAGHENERNTVRIRGESARVVVRQIAGAVARRIVCVVGPGDRVERSATFGMIKFGSRTQVVFPAAVFEPIVKPGQKVKAGTSAIGRLRAAGGTARAGTGAGAETAGVQASAEEQAS